VGKPVGELSLTPTGCALLINEHVTGAVRLSSSNGRCKQGAVKCSAVWLHIESEVRTSLSELALLLAGHCTDQGSLLTILGNSLWDYKWVFLPSFVVWCSVLPRTST
jgi:hypothetical protein